MLLTLLPDRALPTSRPAARDSDVSLLDTTAIPILGVILNASFMKFVFISISTGNTNFNQSRPNLPKRYRQVLLTASLPAYILTRYVMRHYAGTVHDKRLQMQEDGALV